MYAADVRQVYFKTTFSFNADTMSSILAEIYQQAFQYLGQVCSNARSISVEGIF